MYEQDYHSVPLDGCRFLITGGAGFIGSHIVEYLLAKGAGKVRALDNFSTGSKDNLKDFFSNPAFELIEGDICDFNTCSGALKDIDYVAHQAALGSVPRSINDPIKTNATNITGFLNMLTAARDARVKRMIYAASSSVYGDHQGLPKIEDEIGKPLSPYGVTKYVNELYAGVFSRTYGFHTIGMRYFNVFGPRQNPKGPYAAVIPLFIKAALQKQPASINGDGETSRDFTFVENVVQANVKAMFASPAKHEVINVACGSATSLNQVWRMISSRLGVDIPAEYKPQRQGDIKHSLASIEKACSLIGYRPTIPMAEGLEQTIEWGRGSTMLFE